MRGDIGNGSAAIVCFNRAASVPVRGLGYAHDDSSDARASVCWTTSRQAKTPAERIRKQKTTPAAVLIDPYVSEARLSVGDAAPYIAGTAFSARRGSAEQH
jgi:hypothetical protein